MLILIGAGYTLRHFGNKNNEKARVRKERLRLLRKGLKPRAPEASQVIADGFAEEKQSADARGTGSEDEELMERLLDDAYWEMNTDAAAAAIARDEDASSSCTDDDVA